MLREKFGTGVDPQYVYDSCRTARDLHGLPQIETRTRKPKEEEAESPPPVEPPKPAPMPAVTSTSGTTEDMCRELAKAALGVTKRQALQELHITVVNGVAKYSYIGRGGGEIS